MSAHRRLHHPPRPDNDLRHPVSLPRPHVPPLLEPHKHRPLLRQQQQSSGQRGGEMCDSPLSQSASDLRLGLSLLLLAPRLAHHGPRPDLLYQTD